MVFAQNESPIATVYPDGRVVIHKDGGEKLAAEIFWSAFGDKIREHFDAYLKEKESEK
jgi:hypothetical protein